MTFENWAVDGSIPCEAGFCFVPVVLNNTNRPEKIIEGFNYISDKPPGGTFIGVVHPDGQEAAEEFVERFRERLVRLRDEINRSE